MIQYTLGGYSNVNLKSGYTLHRTSYGIGISITDPFELHELLKDTPRTPLVATYEAGKWELTEEKITWKN